jgi:hypothetical protein
MTAVSWTGGHDYLVRVDAVLPALLEANLLAARRAAARERTGRKITRSPRLRVRRMIALASFGKDMSVRHCPHRSKTRV